MEALYLLWSIITTTLTTIILSLLLPFTLLLRRNETTSVLLYDGTVWHERRRPVHHSFKYHVRYAFIDLDQTIHPPPDHLTGREVRDIAQTNGPV
nr:DUF1365 domain-containing protein [Tanacetum cinerariifolium]